MLHTD